MFYMLFVYTWFPSTYKFKFSDWTLDMVLESPFQFISHVQPTIHQISCVVPNLADMACTRNEGLKQPINMWSFSIYKLKLLSERSNTFHFPYSLTSFFPLIFFCKSEIT